MVTPPTIELGSISMADSLILMVLALVVFGPRRLPQIGKQIGKLMYEFRKASNDFKFQMEEELRIAEDADRRKKEEAERQKALAAQTSQESVSAPPAATVNAIENPYASQSGSPDTNQTAPIEPRILPPSTGEQVAASRPDRSSEPSNGSGATVGTEPVTESNQAPGHAGNQESSTTEAVSHNG
ncbi:MAG TPA: twin-arginine translocase TatA/TatE family subunit [Terracidiphilus sp.]|nr:twin-arginine translocase TatA/TatE family subunit [Terracidiphilus sp.]